MFKIIFDFEDNTLGENIFLISMLLILAGCGLAFGWSIILFAQDWNLRYQYNNGSITTEQYCSNFKTSSKPPAVCYEQFKIQKTGEISNN